MNKADKEFQKIVGARILEARINAGLVQEQVAAMLNFSRSQLTNIEIGTCGTTPETIYKLSVIFNCSVVDLFPLPNQYKPKFKLPPTKIKKPGRKVNGPHTKTPAYLLVKENEQLKKELKILKGTANEQ